MALTLSGSSPSLQSYQGGAITSGTAVASTLGTSIDFTGIPSWVKRVTVMFKSVSLSGTANILVQIGAGTPETTGYSSSSIYGGSASGNASSTAGFLFIDGSGSNVVSGTMVITNLSGNNWVETGMVANDGGTVIVTSVGAKSTSSITSIVRITTSNGTDTFDAGSINILYE